MYHVNVFVFLYCQAIAYDVEDEFNSFSYEVNVKGFKSCACSESNEIDSLSDW